MLKSIHEFLFTMQTICHQYFGREIVCKSQIDKAEWPVISNPAYLLQVGETQTRIHRRLYVAI